MWVDRNSPFGMTLRNLDMLCEMMNTMARDVRLEIPQKCRLLRSATYLTEIKYHLIQRAMGQS